MDETTQTGCLSVASHWQASDAIGATAVREVLIFIDLNYGCYHDPSCTIRMTAGQLLIRAKVSELFCNDLRPEAIDPRRCRSYFMGT